MKKIILFFIITFFSLQNANAYDSRYNHCFNFYYSVPSNYAHVIEHASNDGYTFRYHDGIEISVFGFYADRDSGITLWDFYRSALNDNPVLKIYKGDWYVVSKDNGDGTEYYTRAGSYYTNTFGSYSEVIAFMTINYPKSAKKRAQQIIQKHFKGFPQHN